MLRQNTTRRKNPDSRLKRGKIRGENRSEWIIKRTDCECDRGLLSAWFQIGRKDIPEAGKIESRGKCGRNWTGWRVYQLRRVAKKGRLDLSPAGLCPHAEPLQNGLGARIGQTYILISHQIRIFGGCVNSQIDRSAPKMECDRGKLPSIDVVAKSKSGL